MTSISRRSFSPETFRTLALVAACVLVWCFVHDRWTSEAWRIPVEYTADTGGWDVLTVFASIKGAASGYFIPFFPKINPDLGAPFAANWNDYPSNDQLQVFLSGLLADTIGLFPAANLVLLFAHVFAAVSFYLVCRRLKCAWQWAFAGGLAFGFAQFAFAHGQHHLTIAYFWHIPLCLLVCRWASRGSGLRWNDPRYKWALVVAFLAGIQNVYYASMFVQLLGLGCAIQLSRRRWAAILSALSVGATAFGTYMLMNLNMILFRLQHGPNHAIVTRKYDELESFGLKFVDFFMPWQHRIPAIAAWAKVYFRHDFVHGETPPGSYFSILGIAGLVWLIVVSFRRFVLRPVRPLPLEALQVLWIFAYSTVGGMNGLIGNFGFILFRASTRYSIFILCIVLMFLVRRLSVITARRRTAFVAAVAVSAMAAVLWDQLPPIKTDKDLLLNARLVDSDRSFTEAMERRLPDSAMVFQLPVIDFPEDGSGVMPAYDHFRPYLYSRHLRFSFGSDKGRPGADWPHHLKGTIADIIPALEQYGFAAICIERRAYNNNADNLMKNLGQIGGMEIITSPIGDLSCVVLHPSSNPVLPPLTAVQ